MFILGEMDRHTVDLSRVAFEITETAAIGELDAARSLITKLRECGCCFALDDFGSGLSSFAYLKNLPVGYLKIGGGFVRNTRGRYRGSCHGSGHSPGRSERGSSHYGRMRGGHAFEAQVGHHGDRCRAGLCHPSSRTGLAVTGCQTVGRTGSLKRVQLLSGSTGQATLPQD